MNQSKKHKQTGKCKLCLNWVSDLRAGHIVPHWAYRQGTMKNFNRFHNTTEHYTVALDLTAEKEYMFCEKCDNELGSGEDQIRRTFLSPTSENSKTNAIIKPLTFPLFDIEVDKRELLVKGLLGIIFKAHISTLPETMNVNLSKTLFRKTQSFLRGEPGLDKKVSINAIKFFNFNEGASYDYDILKLQTISNPMSIIGIEGCGSQYSVAMAGLRLGITFTNTIVENQNIGVVVTDIKYIRDQPGGRTFESFPTFNVEAVASIRKSILDYDLEGICPCGLRWTKDKKVFDLRKYKDCCYPLWFRNGNVNESYSYQKLKISFPKEEFELYNSSPMLAPLSLSDEEFIKFMKSQED